MGTLTAAAVAAAGTGLYFTDAIHEFASASPRGTRESAPLLTPARTPQPADPSIVIGKWEDRIGTSWRQEIRIIEYAGEVVRETDLPSGRVDRDILAEVTPHANEQRRFVNPSSPRGQAYAITRYGHLAVFDDDGFVHQATKVATSREQR